MGGSIFNLLKSVNGVMYLAITLIVITAIVVSMKITGNGFIGTISKTLKIILRFIGRIIKRKEENYRRDVEIGKLHSKRLRYKFYSFLNDLTIDLNVMQKGVTPYELSFIVMFSVLIFTALGCKIIFNSFLMTIVMYPVVLIGSFALLYTKANLAHDQRIEDVIEAENIISNNIKVGVVVAVRESIDVLPKKLIPVFKKFLDNIEHQNYHKKTALMELNRQLGSVADDFIKKCIVFEMEEEHGIVGMFADIVEINGQTLELRQEMKRAFEEVKFQFRIGAGMILLFLGGVIFIFKDVRNFYFNNWLGQLVIAIDVLILILEYVYLTYLRAKEL